MDLLTVTLIIVLAILTMVFVLVGIYVILVLQESRKILKAIGNPVTSITGLITGIAEGFGTFKSISKIFNREDNDD